VFERYKYIVTIALEAVFLNRFRSILTALGIIFGVAAVIAMMAIGKGAQKQILDQMKLVGVNNIIIIPQGDIGTGSENSKSTSTEQASKGDSKENEKYSPGLTLKDAQSIKSFIPSVIHVSPEIIYSTDVITDGKKTVAKIIGVLPDFFSVFPVEVKQGAMFNEEQLRFGKPVCIIGSQIKIKLFASEDPIGKEIKCGTLWLKVIGVLGGRDVNESDVENLGISDYNKSVYTPIQTLLLRYKDRSAINTSSQQGMVFWGGDISVWRGGGESETGTNQLDKIVVQVKESEQIGQTTEILKRMMLRRHSGVYDFEIKVPELLLKNQQKTKNIFNIVLGAIASISLLVGGIGIMNIMLASVMERIREIGIRQAIGATKRDIVLQFLTEATMISITGGVIGIIVGIALSKIITQLTDILTIVSPLSILLSFGVSATVGIIFGYMPAKRAAKQDPVTSLRHE
jgi:putative ABC transport system permease protein